MELKELHSQELELLQKEYDMKLALLLQEYKEKQELLETMYANSLEIESNGIDAVSTGLPFVPADVTGFNDVDDTLPIKDIGNDVEEVDNDDAGSDDDFEVIDEEMAQDDHDNGDMVEKMLDATLNYSPKSTNQKSTKELTPSYHSMQKSTTLITNYLSKYSSLDYSSIASTVELVQPTSLLKINFYLPRPLFYSLPSQFLSISLSVNQSCSSCSEKLTLLHAINETSDYEVNLLARVVCGCGNEVEWSTTGFTKMDCKVNGKIFGIYLPYSSQ